MPRHFSVVLLFVIATLMPASLVAQPDITVRMGQLNLTNNDPPLQHAGTLHLNIITGQTRTINLLLENSGDTNLTIDALAPIDGPGASHYTILFGPDTLIEPNQGSFLIVGYSPDAPGIHIATLTLNNNDPDENPFVVNLRGECTEAPTGPAPIDVAILGATATSKCNLKKAICTAKGKADTINLATSPSAGFAWMFTPSNDGLFEPGTMFLSSGFTKSIKAYKGFPATLPKKKAKFKALTPTPGANRFVLLLLPVEGDLDYSDNSIEIQFPL